MKVILYMAMSVNGLIAKTDDATHWISQESTEGWADAVHAAGCMIVGRRTYHSIAQSGRFNQLHDAKVVVVSHGTVATTSPEHLIAHTPQQALKLLAGHDEVIVAGGGALNASFIAQNLVDELYVDIEPVIFGSGVPLFHGASFEKKVSPLGFKKFASNFVQLHYKIEK